jgi:hypothetical protein
MKVLGIHIATGQLRFSVLDGTKKSPSLRIHAKINQHYNGPTVSY